MLNKTLKKKSKKNETFKEKLNKNIKIKEVSKIESKETMSNKSNIKEEYIEILKQLVYYNKKFEKGGFFKAKYYSDGINKIEKLDKDLITEDDLLDVSKAVKDKFNEFIKTGKVKNLEELKEKYNNDYEVEKLKNEDNLDAKNKLMQIHGIGNILADKLLKMGITNIEELRKRQNEEIDGKGKKKLKLLNNVQQIGLKYYEETIQRIPRKEIEDYEILFKEHFINTVEDEKEDILNHNFEIVGSYRRGKNDSGDIDIIITSLNNNKKVFDKFLNKLKKENLIEEFLSKGPVKSLVIGRLNKESIARRIDFLYSPPEEYAFAILYFTGSKEFNTAMRTIANNNNLTLSEHGFYKKINKVKEEKIVDVDFKTEKDIFDYLNMKYKEPNERIDENSIELLEIKGSKKETSEIKDTKSKKQVTLKNKVEENNKTLKVDKKKESKENIEKLLRFKNEGIGVLENFSEDELTDMLLESANAYYSAENDNDIILTDDEYDILREHILDKYPKNKIALEQHTQIKLEKDKVKLPYEMWSMNKIKPDINEINKFKKKYKGPYIISAKIDGVSALYSTENGKNKLYTRGNGTHGQNIDHLIEYLNLPKIENITVRGELIIKEKVFIEKYGDNYSNSRNFIAGLVNRKKISNEDKKMFKTIDFVAYELIVPENLKPSDQFSKLLEYKFITAKFISNIKGDNFSNEFLSKTLQEWRENYEYTIDGLVCIDDNIYERQSKNPDHAFAFKMILTEDMVEAKVIDILWNASKNGLLKPTVKFEPVKLSNKIINYSTGHDAKFIVNNKIGLGAIVKLKLAGSTIPNIDSVIKPASNPLMPNEEYVWNETNVDIMVVNKKENKTVIMKNILNFFKILEVQGIGEGNIKKIIETGYDSIGKIIGMTKEDFLKVNGFKEKMANKLFNNIQDKIKDSSIEELAAASNIFGKGFGKVTMEKILNAEPKIFIDDDSNDDKFKKLVKIDGIGNVIAKNFIENIDNFKEFLKDGKLMYKLNEKINNSMKEKNENLLYSKEVVVLSEVKNKKILEEKIIKLGGTISNNMSKKVTLLITEKLDNVSDKINKAKENNVKIITLEEFNKIYENETNKPINDNNDLKMIKKHLNILLDKFPYEEDFLGLENEINLLEEKSEISKADIEELKDEMITILKIGIENEELAESEIKNYESDVKDVYIKMLAEYN